MARSIAEIVDQALIEDNKELISAVALEYLNKEDIIYLAIQQKSYQVLEYLLQSQILPSQERQLHIDPYFFALKDGDVQAARLLFQHHVPCELFKQNLSLKAIKKAATDNHHSVLDFYHELGIKTDYMQPSLLAIAIKKGSNAFISKYIATHQELIHQPQGLNKYPPLLIAVAVGNIEAIKILLAAGADVDVISHNGFSALYLAAAQKNAEIIDVLIAHGANINLIHEKLNDRTTLMMAASNGAAEIAHQLIEAKADVNKFDVKGHNALSYALINHHDNVSKLLLEHKDTSIDYLNARGFTMLHMCARLGDIEQVKMLVEAGASVNKKSKFGSTPLYHACKIGSQAVVDLLLAHGASANLAATPDIDSFHNKSKTSLATILRFATHQDTTFAISPLQTASYFGDVAIMRKLIEAGADVNESNWHGCNALMFALFSGHQEAAWLLINHGAKIDYKNYFKQTPLELSLNSRFEDIAKYIIERAPKLINNADRSCHNSPLIIASKHNLYDIAEILITSGASINHHNIFKQHALICATKAGHSSIIKLLVENGAKVNQQDIIGYTPLMYAAKNGDLLSAQYLLASGATLALKDGLGHTALSLAVEYSHPQIVELLINQQKIQDVKLKENGDHLLHIAASNDEPEILEMLLAKGLKIDAKNKYGETALHVAAASGCLENCKKLFKAGANIYTHDYDGENILHAAVSSHNFETVAFFISLGLDVNKVAKMQLTPLDLALTYEYYTIAELLHEHGASSYIAVNKKAYKAIEVVVQKFLTDHPYLGQQLPDIALNELLFSPSAYEYREGASQDVADLINFSLGEGAYFSTLLNLVKKALPSNRAILSIELQFALLDSLVLNLTKHDPALIEFEGPDDLLIGSAPDLSGI